MRDVVVVGAGPVGMTAAALLAARGVRVAVLEARPATSAEPKAISIDDESLRTYADAGIISEILRIVSPGTGTKYFDRHGQPVFHARGLAPYRLGYPFKNPFAQPDLERTLAAVLDASSGVELRFGTRVTGLDQGADHVAVSVATSGGTETVVTRYVIGADGGRSAVRERLGITMTGRSYEEPWLVIDTLGDPHRQMYGMHFGIPERPTVIIPGKDGRCRYEFLLFPGEGVPGERPGQELIAKLLAPHREITPDQIERAVIYKFNGLVADQWRIGRVFLAGDAAHMMPPFAGQGLNSGLRDVANLCWKLSGVLDGRLVGAVLDSYQDERKPHARASVRLSERLGRVVMSTSPRMAESRDRIIAAALASPQGRAFFEEMRYRPPVAFTSGLVRVTPDTADIVGRPVPQPRGFDMAAGEVRYLDQVTGYGWLVLGVGVTESAWRQVAGLTAAFGASSVHVCADDTLPDAVPADVPVIADVDGAFNTGFGPCRGRFLLVRPDHVIAAAWRPGEEPGVAAAIAAWTGRGGAKDHLSWPAAQLPSSSCLAPTESGTPPPIARWTSSPCSPTTGRGLPRENSRHGSVPPGPPPTGTSRR
jgi:3-(3-hydroxy-phenyl)propionate hydroxylase